MNPFDNYRNAVKRFDTATSPRTQLELSEARDGMVPFGHYSGKELERTIKAFEDNGLLPGIKPVDIGSDYDTRRVLVDNEHPISSGMQMPVAGDIPSHLISPNGWVDGFAHSCRTPNQEGKKVAHEIVAAAEAKNIPVVFKKGEENNLDVVHAVKVSPHIREIEKHPGILLQALAAYAESKGSPAMQKVAMEAMGRVERELLSAMQQQCR